VGADLSRDAWGEDDEETTSPEQELHVPPSRDTPRTRHVHDLLGLPLKRGTWQLQQVYVTAVMGL